MLTLEQVAAWVRANVFRKSDYIAARGGTQHANLPVKTNSSGYVDATLINPSNFLVVTGDTGFSSANTDRYQAEQPAGNCRLLADAQLFEDVRGRRSNAR